MASDSLAELTNRLKQFAAVREWDKFHSPKNLAMALVAEAGELAAEFQWLERVESENLTQEQLARVKSEAADVLAYLVRLADRLGFDLIEAANAKVEVNEGRFPVERVRGVASWVG
jgi:NTP pyrophosphatase (non-canonical NTP hydrolase)